MNFNKEGVEEFISAQSPLMALIQEIKNTLGLPLTVHDKLSKPHELIVRKKKEFKECSVFISEGGGFGHYEPNLDIVFFCITLISLKGSLKRYQQLLIFLYLKPKPLN